jgi:hypothetical protein
MSIGDISDRERAGARVVGRGRFRVDASRALEKLRDFRLADPSHYVLDLLRAAVASGATRVEVRNDADDFELSFDGAPFAPEVLEDLLSYALGGGVDAGTDGPRYQLLATGIVGALGLRPKLVLVRGSGSQVRVFRDGRIAATALPGDGCTRVHVRERAGWRVLRDLIQGPPEEQAIVAHATGFPVPLVVNGLQVNRPLDLGVPVVTTAVEQFPGGWLVTGLPAEPLPLSTLTLEILGVKVTRRGVRLSAPQVVGWIRDDALRRNASGADVLDEDVGTAADRLREARYRLLAAAIGGLGQSPGDPVRAALVGHAESLGQQARDSVSARSLRLLEAAPLLPQPAGDWTSIAVIREELRRGRPLRVTGERLPRELYDPPVVLLDPRAYPYQRLLPATAFHQLAPVAELQRRRDAARAAFAARPVEPGTLPPGPVRVQLRAAGVQGELALGAGNACAVRLLHQGRLLGAPLDDWLAPLRVDAVVAAERIRPDALFEAPLADDAYAELYAYLRRVARRVVLRTVTAATRADALDDDLRRHGRDLIVDLARSRASARLPAALLAAPLFRRGDRTWVSLGELRRLPVCPYVVQTPTTPALSPLPYLVLDERERAVFEHNGLLGEVPLLDVTGRLGHQPVAGSRYYARVPIMGAGLHGELAGPAPTGDQLVVKLQCDGFLIEQILQPVHRVPAVAVVECPDLRPDRLWREVQPGPARDAALQAVAAAEGPLLSLIVDGGPTCTPLEKLPQEMRDLVVGTRGRLLTMRTLEALEARDAAAPAAAAPDESRGAELVAELISDVVAEPTAAVAAPPPPAPSPPPAPPPLLEQQYRRQAAGEVVVPGTSLEPPPAPPFDQALWESNDYRLVAARAWREPLAATGITGEVCLPAKPSGKLKLVLAQPGHRLRRGTRKHPVGGLGWARCESAEGKTKVGKRVGAAAEDALERLVVRVLREGQPADWRPLLPALAAWQLGTAGPVAAALAALPAFGDVRGAPVTLGQVLEVCAGGAAVTTLAADLRQSAPPGDHLVLACSAEDYQLLGELGFPSRDRSNEVRAEQERSSRIAARRLPHLGWAGPALVRVAVNGEGWTGELALPFPLEVGPQLLLSRGGIHVGQALEVPFGVAGVLDRADLPVDAEWRLTALGDAERAFIQGAVDGLFAALAAAAPRLEGELREAAAVYVLRYLGDPTRPPPATGPGAALLHLKLFVTPDERLVDLAAVVERVMRYGAVGVVDVEISARELRGDVVLRASNLAAPWVQQLQASLGEARVELSVDADVWRARRLEEDADAATPLGAGLRRLRAEAEILRAAACGGLQPGELVAIKLHRHDRGGAVSYDARRGVVLLDPDEPLVRETLAGAATQPAQLYVLLAAIFGAINRALERVTDEHEARLAAALLAHLDANPTLLDATTAT